MSLENEINTNKIFTQQLNDVQFKNQNIQLDVLRLDEIHPVVSGNKWFKLKNYLQQAIENNSKTIATFGGAFSNHILATAYACYQQKLNCIGFIRGEEPKQYSQTLLDAKALNMQLKFLSREEYSNRQNIIESNTDIFFIPVGGYGKPGAKGAEEIIKLVPEIFSYNYIVCAVGTGTMLAGIANAGSPQQQCIGISVMKNNFNLENEVSFLLSNEMKNRIQVLHDYHFGGYAKYNSSLINFMNEVCSKNCLPLDFIYTAKALYAVYDLTKNNYFSHGSNILFIHSGGLQGNCSLPAGLLNSDIIISNGGK